MGYRNYFNLIDIKKYNEIKNLKYHELIEYYKKNNLQEDDDYIDLREIFDKEVFEFGKLYYDNTADRIYSKGIPLFTNKETQSSFDDYVPYIMGKEALIEAFNIYREKTITYYEGLKQDGDEAIIPLLGITIPCDKSKEEKIFKSYKDKCWDLINDKNYKTIELITNSWLYEYSVFNLIYLYKTIDWEKYYLIFWGW